MRYEWLNNAAEEIITFSRECPYYFGLQATTFGLPKGISDFPRLHSALESLKAWSVLPSHEKENTWEKAQPFYADIIQALAHKDFCTPKGNKSLHWPSRGYPCLVEALIQAGAEVDARDDFGNSPLMHASTYPGTENEKDRILIVQHLLDAGANIMLKINCRTDHNTQTIGSPLRITAENGFSYIVEMMLKHPKTNLNDVKPSLHFLGNNAINHEKPAILSHLIQIGFDVNAAVTIGNEVLTSLHIAAFTNNGVDCLKILIAAGADLNKLDNLGRSSLTLALMANKPMAALMLVERGAAVHPGGQELIMAAEGNNFLLIKALIAAGANVNARGNAQNTPLMLAASRNNLDIVNLLIIKGASLDLKNDNDFSALYVAASNGFNDIVHTLLTAGANVNITGPDDLTPLVRATFNNHPLVVATLLSYGAIIPRNDLPARFVL